MICCEKDWISESLQSENQQSSLQNFCEYCLQVAFCFVLAFEQIFEVDITVAVYNYFILL